MAQTWILMNGQRDLRANIRSAIGALGITQRRAAELAEMKYSALVQGLAGNRWLARPEVERLAAVLDADCTSLMGESIFKEAATINEFDYRPPEFGGSAPIDTSEPLDPRRRRALCCECGTLRICADRSEIRDNVRKDGRRMLGHLECVTCNEITRHALLRDHDGEYAHAAEEVDHRPSRSRQAARELATLVRRVESFNVDVHIVREATSKKAIYYEYDESKSRWRIELNDVAPSEMLLTGLSHCWRSIATGEWGEHVTWDPAEGTAWSIRDGGWSTVTDNLIEDIQRFGPVERRRMAMDITDPADREETS